MQDALIEQLCVSPIRSLQLQRRPYPHHPSLQAWDSADLLLLNELKQADLLERTSLLVNDQFGALACNLSRWQPRLWLDSAVEILACQHNLELNQLAELQMVAQHQLPPQAEQVLIKIPRSSALLDWQLAVLNQQLPLGTQVWLAGMVKHLGRAHQQVIEQRLSHCFASRIEKKAKFWSGRTQAQNSLPTNKLLRLESPWQLALHNHPGLYSRDSIDPGARCLLEHLHLAPQAGKVLDLCAGNGILGMAYQRLQPQARLQYSDASSAALISCQQSLAANGLTGLCHHTDGLLHLDKDFELILCNPPFHQHNSVSTDTAKQLFTQARAHLKPKGQLLVVANRHLPYHPLLKSRYPKVKSLAKHPKFSLYLAGS